MNLVYLYNELDEELVEFIISIFFAWRWLQFGPKVRRIPEFISSRSQKIHTKTWMNQK